VLTLLEDQEFVFTKCDKYYQLFANYIKELEKNILFRVKNDMFKKDNNFFVAKHRII